MFELQERGLDGKFLCWTLKLVAGEFHVIPGTITRVWARACQNYENPLIRQFCSSPQKKKCGRHKNGNAMKFAKLSN
jgi:hypothetical protein